MWQKKTGLIDNVRIVQYWLTIKEQRKCFIELQNGYGSDKTSSAFQMCHFLDLWILCTKGFFEMSVLEPLLPDPENGTQLKSRAHKVSESSKDDHFEPYVILEFDPKSKQAALEWLTAKLQAPRVDGGAELLVHTNHGEEEEETVLYVGATIDRLLIGAEEARIQKAYKNGGALRDLSLTDIYNFENTDDLDSFLTSAEKQRVILKAIESIRATEDETHIPGYPKHLLYPGKSVIKKYLSRKIVTSMYPLHEEEKLKRLTNEWCMFNKYLSAQPIDTIQQYFGTKIAIYFSFLGFYTVSLIPPAMIGIIYFLYPWASMYREATFAVFNLIWTTIFLEAWKRYCNTQCFKWGVLEGSGSLSKSLEEPRADYYGTMGTNAVTGNPEPVYPKWKRVAKFYLVTVPIISICLTVAFCAMLGYFWAEHWIKKNAPQDMGFLTTLQNLLPTIVYAIAIGILNNIYRTIAAKLNKYENHRLQSSYENHLIVKLILFEFINCFICLFYVAFYLQDRALLKTFLGTVLVTQQIVGQVQEAMVPFFFMKRRQTQLEQAAKRAGDSKKGGNEAPALERQTSNGTCKVDDSFKKQAALEGLMDDCTGCNDEYLEMYIQFGYVYLFSSTFPLAALWALINNFIEIRSDAFKFCKVFRRPFTQQANSIGAWQPAFEIIGLISVITNCALIGMDPEVKKLLPSELSPVNYVLIFVAAEHIVLAIKATVAILVPDLPKWVSLQMARQEFMAKMALRKQRIIDAAQKKKVLMDAFKAKALNQMTS
ncbi:anoctamin [Plakobranchus ocellatus]|uniref:Anoctamin n=1 Tax=Plakobranchus ocellatus TaxID=259542 RepID=A0AAV4C1V6_9GAST|nr:anoctamin [Plakobranchus ocellatus]